MVRLDISMIFVIADVFHFSLSVSSFIGLAINRHPYLVILPINGFVCDRCRVKLMSQKNPFAQHFVALKELQWHKGCNFSLEKRSQFIDHTT